MCTFAMIIFVLVSFMSVKMCIWDSTKSQSSQGYQIPSWIDLSCLFNDEVLDAVNTHKLHENQTTRLDSLCFQYSGFVQHNHTDHMDVSWFLFGWDLIITNI